MSVAEVPPQRATRPAPSPLWQAVKAVASLRLTVVLFLLSMVLVFAGTLAQLNEGVWTVVDRYFRSAVVWIPVQLFVQLGQVFVGLPPTFKVNLSFPFPGGMTLGILLFVNIVAAHLTRFRLNWKRGGVLIVHAGLIVLFAGEVVLWLAGRDVEARMTMAEGETVNYVEMSRKVELALTDSSNPTKDEVVVVPGDELKKNVGKVIADDQLPVDIRVDEYADNADLTDPGEKDGPDVFATPMGRVRLATRAQGVGVDTGSHDDAALARVTLLEKGTAKEVGTFVVSLWQQPNFTSRLPRFAFAAQTAKVGGKDYAIELRPKRVYKPFAVKLMEFRHDVYPGTDTPKNYSSEVEIKDAAAGDDRTVLIRMNAPLRYRGDTYYQSGVLQGKKGTVLQVVRNPGWTLPYIACVMVMFGMVWHFGIGLWQFLARRAA